MELEWLGIDAGASRPCRCRGKHVVRAPCVQWAKNNASIKLVHMHLLSRAELFGVSVNRARDFSVYLELTRAVMSTSTNTTAHVSQDVSSQASDMFFYTTPRLFRKCTAGYLHKQPILVSPWEAGKAA